MIRSFRGKDAQQLFRGLPTRRFGNLARIVQRKLLQLDAATRLDDLRAFPGNQVKELKGDRQGEHSIRINDQYRICFVWQDGDAHRVEVVDYH